VLGDDLPGRSRTHEETLCGFVILSGLSCECLVVTGMDRSEARPARGAFESSLLRVSTGLSPAVWSCLPAGWARRRKVT
jgi:hypothetical protein